MRKTIFALTCIILILGCIGTGKKNVAETKLTAYQGLGILSFEPRGGKEAPPGGENYLSLVVRNNAAGGKASNIVASIDNVEPFKIRDCKGNYVSSSDPNTACVNPIFLDTGYPYSQHRLSKLDSGEEMEMLWLIRAPAGPEITQSEYSQKIYATLSYDYTVSSGVNIVALSQDEITRRRTAKEDYNVRGETTNTAGDLSINSETTVQPVIFPSEGEVSPTYYLIFNVENVGQGLPQGDVFITIYAPKGIIVESNIARSPDYKWGVVDSNTADGTYTIRDNKLTCNMASSVYKKDCGITDTDIILGNTFILPFKISELKTLNDAGITEKTYTFFIDVGYSYLISSDTQITVKPF